MKMILSKFNSGTKNPNWKQVSWTNLYQESLKGVLCSAITAMKWLWLTEKQHYWHIAHYWCPVSDIVILSCSQSTKIIINEFIWAYILLQLMFLQTCNHSTTYLRYLLGQYITMSPECPLICFTNGFIFSVFMLLNLWSTLFFL